MISSQPATLPIGQDPESRGDDYIDLYEPKGRCRQLCMSGALTMLHSIGFFFLLCWGADASKLFYDAHLQARLIYE